MPTRPSDEPKRDKEARQHDDEIPASDEKVVPPAGKTIGEGDDNLRQRADWFQKRTGGKQ